MSDSEWTPRRSGRKPGAEGATADSRPQMWRLFRTPANLRQKIFRLNVVFVAWLG